MKDIKQHTAIASIAAALLLVAMPLAHATAEVNTLVSANRAICGSPSHKQIQDLKLAAKAQEGASAFMQYVRANQQRQQWTAEEAIQRAQAAAVSACGVAIGLKPIEQTELATMIAANSR